MSPAPALDARRPRSGQRGFTLVEVMVALVISSILIAMVLSIFSRMSLAYRSQQQVSELQQVLRAALAVMQKDIRQAGYQVPGAPPVVPGFRFLDAGVVTDRDPIEIVNAADASETDLIRLYYADAAAQARVTARANPITQVTVDDAAQFAQGNIVVLVVYDGTATTPIDLEVGGHEPAIIATFHACVVRITDITGTVVSFDTTDALNDAINSHCASVAAADDTGIEIMMYRFVGRSYRIDPDRKALAVLQVSPSGELVDDDWVDLGVGFTDLQIASRRFEATVTGIADVDVDGDGDPLRDWYSSEAQEVGGARPPGGVITTVSVALAVRTSKRVEGVPSAMTPSFIDADDPEHNRIGDHAAIQLDGEPDASRPEEHRGDHIYRYAWTAVDVRNVGVGR